MVIELFWGRGFQACNLFQRTISSAGFHNTRTLIIFRQTRASDKMKICGRADGTFTPEWKNPGWGGGGGLVGRCTVQSRDCMTCLIHLAELLDWCATTEQSMSYCRVGLSATPFLQIGQIFGAGTCFFSFFFSCKESVGESEDWSEEGYNCTTTTVRLKLIIILLLFEGRF